MLIRPLCQTLSKALDISHATAWVAQDLLKALVILSDTTVRRSEVDQEYLKGHFSLGDQQVYHLKVFQRLILSKDKFQFFQKNLSKGLSKNNGVLVFSCRPFPQHS